MIAACAFAVRLHGATTMDHVAWAVPVRSQASSQANANEHDPRGPCSGCRSARWSREALERNFIAASYQ